MAAPLAIGPMPDQENIPPEDFDWEAYVQQLGARIDALQGQLAGMPAPAPLGPHAGGILKTPKPDTFAGHGRDRNNVDDWLFSVNNYFASLAVMPTDRQRIAYVGSLFTGPARKWHRLYSYPQLQNPAQPVAYADFVAGFRAVFGPVNATSKARDRLDGLKQTGSVQAYTSAFREILLEIPDMSAADRLHRYVTGLKTHIQQQVQVQNPTTMDGAIQIADRLDAIKYDGTRAIGAAVSTAQSRASTARRPAWRPPGPQQRPVPMEIGTAQVQHTGWRPPPPPSGGKTRLSPEERAYLTANNGCLFCRRLGHTVDQCRQRSNPGNFARPSLQQGNGMRPR
jgi:hypothetical protein